MRVREVIKLDDGLEYVVANKCTINKTNYYLFVDLETQSIIKVCGEVVKGGKPVFKEVKENDKLFMKILKLFNDNYND